MKFSAELLLCRFYDDESCFLLAKGNTTFFLAKLYVKRSFEWRLIKNAKGRFRQQSHLYNFTWHFKVIILIADNPSGGGLRKAA